MHWRETAPLCLVWIVKSVWAWESLILFQTTFSNSKYLSYSLIKINSLDTLADFSITMAQLGQLGYCIFHCIWGRCCSRITSPTLLIWMLIWRFLSDTLMLFTTILWRVHFDSWEFSNGWYQLQFALHPSHAAQYCDSYCSPMWETWEVGRDPMVVWEVHFLFWGAGSFSSTSQIKASVTARYQFTSRGTKVVHAHKYRSVYLRSQADNTLQHTHARVDTHELDGFLLYLGFSPW